MKKKRTPDQDTALSCSQTSLLARCHEAGFQSLSGFNKVTNACLKSPEVTVTDASGLPAWSLRRRRKKKGKGKGEEKNSCSMSPYRLGKAKRKSSYYHCLLSKKRVFLGGGVGTGQ